MLRMSVVDTYVQLTADLERVTINDIVYQCSYKLLKRVECSVLYMAIDNGEKLTINADVIPEACSEFLLNDIIRDAIIHLHTDYLDTVKYNDAERIYSAIMVANYLLDKRMVKKLIYLFHGIAHELGKCVILKEDNAIDKIKLYNDKIIRTLTEHLSFDKCNVVKECLDKESDKWAKLGDFNIIKKVTRFLFITGSNSVCLQCLQLVSKTNCKHDSICLLYGTIKESMISVDCRNIFTETQISMLIEIINMVEPCQYETLPTKKLFELFSVRNMKYIVQMIK